MRKRKTMDQLFIPFEEVPPRCRKLCRKQKQSFTDYLANLKLTIYSVRPLILLVPLSELTSFERVPWPSDEMISAYSKHYTQLSIQKLARLTGLTDEKAYELMGEIYKEFSREFNSTRKPTCSMFDLEAFLEARRYNFGKDVYEKK
jgi:hypothetical protein